MGGVVRRTPALRRGLSTLLLLPSLALAGCFGPKNFENENDTLRREKLELTQQTESLERQVASLEGQVAALREQLAGPDTPVPGADPPVVARIEIDALSGLTDSDGEPGNDVLRVYVKPYDQRRRFHAAAGKAVVQAVAIEPDQPPRLLMEKTYGPGAFDDAYRSGFLGTHFTLDLSLPDGGLPDGVEELTVKVTFTDAVTGREHTAERGVTLSP